jgi:hypothetical protein
MFFICSAWLTATPSAAWMNFGGTIPFVLRDSGLAEKYPEVGSGSFQHRLSNSPTSPSAV